MSWPAVLLWLGIPACALARGPLLLYMFSITQCVTTLQMLPGDGGGVNVVPQVICAAVLVARIFTHKGNLVRALAVAADPRRIGLFTAFVLYALLSAVALPRIFEGQIEVIPLTGNVLGPSLLAPGAGNVTQVGYLLMSFATAVAFATGGSNPAFRMHFLYATLAGGMALIATGVIDLATYVVGLGSLLEPWRTVSYSLLTDNEVLGAKRVVGLMTEASAFGASCVVAAGTLTFLRPCYGPRARRLVVPLTIGGLVAMGIASTSSSAYIGFTVFGAAFAANWLVRLLSRRALARADLKVEFGIVAGAAFALLCVLLLAPAVFEPVVDMLNVLIFNKSSTDSYYVRTMWTTTGWNAFLSTGLLGVGYGGLRTSNWLVALAGNVGLFGTVLMFGFILITSLGGSRALPDDIREFRRGLAFSLLPGLVMSLFIGTTTDIGVAGGAAFGMLAATGTRKLATLGPVALASRVSSDPPSARA